MLIHTWIIYNIYFFMMFKHDEEHKIFMNFQLNFKYNEKLFSIYEIFIIPLQHEKKGRENCTSGKWMSKRGAHFLSIIEVLLLDIKKGQINKIENENEKTHIQVNLSLIQNEKLTHYS